MNVITTENLAEAFDQAARRYDLMAGLNPGYHRHLRSAAESLVEALPKAPGPKSSGSRTSGDPRGSAIVDLGCGSGASTRALQRSLEAAGLAPEVIGIDASAGMVGQARAKSWPDGIRFELGMAEELVSAREQWGLSEPRRGVFASYLFRNVGERDKVLAEVHDLLIDDGVLVVQEYSVAGSRRAAVIWSIVCWLVVIPLSWLTQRKTRLYRYLWRSVLTFDSVQGFVDRLYGAGFVDVEVRSVPGWQRGILHTFRARKPALPDLS